MTSSFGLFGLSASLATPPPHFTVTAPTTNATVPSHTVTFTGTGTPASMVQVLDASGAEVSGTTSAVVGADGVWTTTGTFAATAPTLQHLNAEQMTGGSADGSVTLAIRLPAETTTRFAVTGPPANLTEPSRTVTFTGTGTPASMVQVLDASGGQLPGTTPAVVGADGVWTTTGTFPATAPVTEHPSVQQTTSGKANGSVALVLQLPAAAYPFILSAPPSDTAVPSRTVTFTGTGTPASIVRILASGVPVSGTTPTVVGSDGIWTTTGTFSATAPVIQRLSAQQTTSGKPNGTVALVVQLPAPTHPFALSAPASNAPVPSRTIAFTGTGTPASTVLVLDGGGAPVSGTTAAVVSPTGIWSTTGTFSAAAPPTEHLSAQQTTAGSANGHLAFTIQLPAATPTPLATTGPALTLTTSATPTSFSGTEQTISYQFLVKNTGTDTLTAIGVTDNKVSAANLHCPTPSLAAGAHEACTGTYATTQADIDAGSVTDSATATGTPPSGGPVTSAPATFTVSGPTAAPAIALTTSAAQSNFRGTGQTISYQYVIKNTGNVTLTAIGVSSNRVSAADLRCPSASLAPAASETCTGTYATTQADVDAGSLAESATATGTPPSGGPVTSAPSALNIPGPAAAPALTLTKTATKPSFSGAGQLLSYNYLVKNTGNVTLTAIGVTDNKVSAANLHCPSATLAPAASETCTGTYTTTTADVVARAVRNTAVARALPPRATAPVQSNTSVAVVPLVIPSSPVTRPAAKSAVSPQRVRVTG